LLRLDRFGTALGRDVRVEPQKTGGFRLTVELADGAEAEILLGRVG
jgi:hypothetical protein